MFQGDFNVSNEVFIASGMPFTPFVDERYESGIGGRFTVNINRYLAVESEVNFTPSTPTHNELLWAGITPTRRSSGGEKTQFLVGVKSGYRWKRFGIFAKARPGFIRFNAFNSVDAKYVLPSPTGGPPVDVLLFLSEKPATFFNMDIGGVFEYYTSKRTMIRFDIGDTIIHYNAQKPRDVNPTFTRHNPQMNLGFGFRF